MTLRTLGANTAALNNAYASGGEYRSKVKADGTDQSTVLLAEIATAGLFGAATIILPAGTIRLDSRIDLPYTLDGNGAPVMPSLTLKGQGMQSHGRGSGVALTPTGGTVLDMRFSNATTLTDGSLPGKLVARGFGYLEVTGITFTDGAGGANPFIRHTNTTVNIHDVAGIGSKTGTACDQDLVMAGGKTIPGTGDFGLTEDSPFQGYGSKYRNIWHNGIRRAVVGGAYFNQVTINDITGWQKSGNSNGASVEIDPGTGTVQGCYGIDLSNVLCEAGSYKYAVKLRNVGRSRVSNVSAYDIGGGTFISTLLLDGCSALTIMRGYDDIDGTHPYITAASGNWRDQATLIHGSRVANVEDMNLGGVVQMWGGALVRNNGGGSGSSLLFSRAADATTGNQIGFSNYGATWGWASGAGSNMKINTGTGGSYLDVNSFGLRLYNHSGTLRFVAGDSLGEGGKAGIQLDASGTVPPVIYGIAGASGGGVVSVKVGDVLRSGRAVTGSRPSASTSGAGAQFYDTTLSKPIWSDGTVWRDSAGTAV